MERTPFAITLDPNTGLANGAWFIDRRSKREYHAKAKVVIVGASVARMTH